MAGPSESENFTEIVSSISSKLTLDDAVCVNLQAVQQRLLCRVMGDELHALVMNEHNIKVCDHEGSWQGRDGVWQRTNEQFKQKE